MILGIIGKIPVFSMNKGRIHSGKNLYRKAEKLTEKHFLKNKMGTHHPPNAYQVHRIYYCITQTGCLSRNLYNLT